MLSALVLSAFIAMSPSPDFNGDSQVDVSDLLILLSHWGPCDGSCPYDLTHDGIIDISDLLMVLGSWGNTIMDVVAIEGFERGDSPIKSGDVSFVAGRSGDYAMRANPTGTGTAAVTVAGILATTGVSDAATGFSEVDAYASFWLRVATAPASGSEPICKVRSNTTDKLTLRLNANRTLSLDDAAGSLIGTTSGTVPDDEWVRIGIRAGNGTDAAYEMLIGDESELSGTADQGENDVTNIQLGKVANVDGNTVDLLFDDVAICSDEFVDLDAAIAPLRIARPGTNNSWNGSYRDAQSNDGDDSYLEIINSSNASTFGMSDPLAAGICGTVHAVQMSIFVRGVSGTPAVRCRMVSSGTLSDTSSNSNPGTSYAWRGQMRTTDPATSSAWSVKSLARLEIGPRSGSSSTATTRCTYTTAEVLYTPPTYTDVASATELQNAGTNSTTKALHYRFTQDIDVSGIANWTPIGTDAEPFTGSIDANGFKITGTLSIDRATAYNGLIGVDSATAYFKDIAIEQVDIEGGSRTGAFVGEASGLYSNCIIEAGSVVRNDDRRHGGFVATATGTADFFGCISHASVNTVESQAGGFVGMAIGSSTYYSRPKFYNCYATGAVTASGEFSQEVGGFAGLYQAECFGCFATGDVTNTGTTETGGFVGECERGSFFDCYARGTVSGVDEVGGFAGQVQGATAMTVHRCYSTGAVSGSGSDVGGFAGVTDAGDDVQDCFFDADVSGQASDGTGGKATAKTTAQMQDIATYTDTDTSGLDSPWEMVSYASHVDEMWAIDTSEYPVLGFEVDNEPEPIPTTSAPCIPYTESGEPAGGRRGLFGFSSDDTLELVIGAADGDDLRLSIFYGSGPPTALASDLTIDDTTTIRDAITHVAEDANLGALLTPVVASGADLDTPIRDSLETFTHTVGAGERAWALSTATCVPGGGGGSSGSRFGPGFPPYAKPFAKGF